MRTNVAVDGEKVTLLMRLTGARSKTAAVTLAVDEQIRREKLGRLASLLGKVDVDAEAVSDLRTAETDKQGAFPAEPARGSSRGPHPS